MGVALTTFSRRSWGASLLAGTAGLAACGPKPPAPPPAPAGAAYIFYYQDAAGVHPLDARSAAYRRRRSRGFVGQLHSTLDRLDEALDSLSDQRVSGAPA